MTVCTFQNGKLLVAVLLGFLGNPLTATEMPRPESFRYYASLHVDTRNAKDSIRATFRMNSDIFRYMDSARMDLRIIDTVGKEIPFRIRRIDLRRGRPLFPVKLFQPERIAELQEEEHTVMLFRTWNEPVSSISVFSSSPEFTRPYRLEYSEDLKTFHPLLQGVLSRECSSSGEQTQNIILPYSDLRAYPYLRLNIENGMEPLENLNIALKGPHYFIEFILPPGIQGLLVLCSSEMITRKILYDIDADWNRLPERSLREFHLPRLMQNPQFKRKDLYFRVERVFGKYVWYVTVGGVLFLLAGVLLLLKIVRVHCLGRSDRTKRIS